MIDFTNSQNDNFDFAMFGIPKNVVEEMNLDYMLKDGLDKLVESQEMIKKCKNKVMILFDGYNEDRREIYEIFEVRDYIQALTLDFPYWFYFCSTDPKDGTLRVIHLAHCRFKNFGPGGAKVNVEDANKNYDFLLQHLIDFYSKYNLDKADLKIRITEVADYFRNSKVIPL